ncbi:uncharacterized protein LOC131436914 [Malaya genurostris]|uniref:uncharacterized protein LOC131436914 n=1 Tax=Malaya genurostris TaxID=325434 RepID=UPI0026F3CD25|nr:uncharacterized protein LOC131436914 [Malaya genurostris]
MSHWEITFPDRKVMLRDKRKFTKLLDKYPQIQDEFGYQLLDIDYQLLGFGNPSEKQKKWALLLDPIAEYVAKNGKDLSVKELLPIITNTENSLDTRLLAALRGLSAVLIPVKAANGFKPTIATAQSDTFCIVKSKEEVFENLKKTNSVLQNETGVLKLFILGENLFAVGECVIVFGDNHYVLPNVVRGLDVFVKIALVLGLPTSKVSKLIWEFVLKFIYNTDKTINYVSVKKLIKFIESCTSNVAL